MRRLNIPIFLLTIFMFFSCKDDSTSSGAPTIEITDGSHSFIQLNDCDIGGTPATEFIFELIYNASSDIDIDGVEFDLAWSSGDQDNNIFVNSFNADDETVVFDWCFRYGDVEQWFELDLKILAEDEKVESNEYTIRVEKPEGANKSAASGRN